MFNIGDKVILKKGTRCDLLSWSVKRGDKGVVDSSPINHGDHFNYRVLVGNKSVELDEDNLVLDKGNEITVDKYWICYVEGTDGGRRYRHYTLQSAQTEAERLARQTNQCVSIFEFKGSCKVNLPPVNWEIPR